MPTKPAHFIAKFYIILYNECIGRIFNLFLRFTFPSKSKVHIKIRIILKLCSTRCAFILLARSCLAKPTETVNALTNFIKKRSAR